MHAFSDDDNFQILEKILTQAGKGRRPDLPTEHVTHRLLLQIMIVKENEEMPWDTLERKSMMDELETMTINKKEN